MKRILYLFIFLLLLIFDRCQPVRNESSVMRGKIYSNVTIVDGLGNDPYLASLVIEGSIINEISSEPIETSGYEIIDCSGQYLIPGLIDTHIHATVLDFDDERGHQSSVDMEASLSSLGRMAQYGVMYARSVAGPLKEGLELKQIISAEPNPYPSIVISGLALNKSDYPPFVRVESKADVLNEVTSQYENGADYIKIYASVEPELAECAIREAHKRGLKVVGHLQRTSWTEAAQMGIDFITHAAPWSNEYLIAKFQNRYIPTMKGRLDWIEWVDYNSSQIQEMIQVMKNHGVMFDPTLIAFHTKFWAKDSSYIFNSDREKLPASVSEMWDAASFVGDWSDRDFQRAQSLWPKLTELTYRIYEAGIPITIGTDFPNPWVYPGLSVHKEMQLLNESGIPMLDVIKMATYNGAVALGIADKTGSIEKGKLANLIFLNSNPIEDVENTRDISFIVKNGVQSKKLPFNKVRH